MSILAQNIGVMATIMQDIAILAGIGLIISSLFQFHRYGQSRGMTTLSYQSSATKPLLTMVAGIFLLCFPTTLTTALLAVWGSSSPIAYTGSTDDFSSLTEAVVMFVRLIGLGAFMRGCILIARSTGEQSQHGTMSKCILHLIGGVLCVNVIGTYDLLLQLLGIAY